MLDNTPIRDTSGRILDGVTFESSDEEIAQAVARRDASDARNLADLRRVGRLGNQWDRGDSADWS
ncbi:MAG: hypothetical protein ACJ72E_09625 [Marmoricola sp.]